MHIFYFLFWIILLEFKSTVSIKVNIFSNGSAFLKFTEKVNSQEIIYKQPLEDKLLVSVGFGELKASKELERSKYKSQVFTDKENLSFQSNLMKDSFTINSICKFDHDKQAAFALDKVCCEITVRRSDEFARIIARKMCKLEISHTSSACYAQLELLKDSFDIQRSSEFEVELNSRVFSSRDSKCHDNSSTLDNLALGYPLRMLVTQGLLVKWETTDVSETFGELKIGIPVDSIDVNSKTIFPLKIRMQSSYFMIVIACTFGDELSLSDISFESTRFEGEFKKSLENVVKITVTQKDGTAESGDGDSIGEHLVNLRVRVMGGRRKKTSQSAHSDYWISCRVERAFGHKSKEPIVAKSDQNTKRVFVNVNEDGFIIIPIMKKSVLFSTINPVFGPIELESNHLKIFNVHSIRDGSLIDITLKTSCNALSNTTLTCPAGGGAVARVVEKQVIRNPNWNVILSMMSWQKMFSAPFELWQAEDWQLITSDKTLNRIANWNHPKQSKGGCTPVFQAARTRLFARLVRQVVNLDKVYFGQNGSECPLLDMTSRLSIGNVVLSNANIEVGLQKHEMLISMKSVGTTDLSVVNNLRNKVAVDLIRVSEEFVQILDLNVSCVYNLNLTHSANYDDPSFRSIVINTQQSQSPQESCYLRVILIFSDGSSADLMDYRHTDFQLSLVHSEGSVSLGNLDGFLYEPMKYREPGRFSINLYESDQCLKNNLIVKKQVDLYKHLMGASSPRPSISGSISTTKNQDRVPGDSRSSTTSSADKRTKVASHSGIDTDTLFLSMKILIGLVLLVVFIIILNCIIKFRNRKSACLLDRQLNTCQLFGGPTEKLTTSTYSPIDMTSENLNSQHPPLLPPPGPLYNHSDSSQLDLAANASPDMFWSFPNNPGDSSRDRTGPTNHTLVNIPMSSINGSGNSVTFPHIFPSSRRTSPSPHSDSLDYNFINSNGSKLPLSRPIPPNSNGYSYPSGSLHDSDSLASGSGSKTSSQVAAMVPPCPPLRWNTNWHTSQFPIYFPNEKELSLDPSLSQFSNDQSSQNSLTPSHSGSWGIKQPLVLPPIGFNSADNVCEKSSSGLGSLSSTQPGSDCSKKECGAPNATNYSGSH